MANIAIGEAFERVVDLMSGYTDEIECEVSNIFNELNDILRNNPWQVIYKTGLGLQKAYNEEVIERIKTEIHIWEEGDGSYVYITKRFKMGNDATSIARSQQDRIVEKIDHIKVIDVFSGFDGSETHFDVDIIKSNLEGLLSNAARLSSIVENNDRELNSLITENESIKSIVNVGIIFGKSIANFTQKVIEQIRLILSEQFDEMIRKNDDAIVNANNEAERFSQSLDDQVASMQSLLNELFGDDEVDI